MKENTSVVLLPEPSQHGDLSLDGSIVIQKSPTTPEITGPNDVLIQMKSVGICGSDVHYWRHGRIGDYIVKAPMIIGHECCGTVVQVGSGVSHLQPGDTVALEPGIPCRLCSLCKNGLYNLCKDMKFFATPPVHGAMSTFVVHPGDFCFKMPAQLPTESGALIEPLSVAVHSCKRAGVSPGCTVGVFGAGPIGLILCMVARAFGAASISLFDISQQRLKFAQDLDVADAVASSAPSTASFAVTFDASGAAPAISAAINATEPGGVFVGVGMGGATTPVPLLSAACKEVDIKGIFRYRNCYPTAISLLASGAYPFHKLITHRIPVSLSAPNCQSEVLKGFSWAAKVRTGRTRPLNLYNSFCCMSAVHYSGAK